MFLVIICLLLFLAHVKLTFMNRTLIESYNYSRAKEPVVEEPSDYQLKNMNAALQQFYSLEIPSRRHVFLALCDDVHGHEFELLYRSTVGSNGPHMASNLQEFLLICSHDVFTKFFDTVVNIKNYKEPRPAPKAPTVAPTVAPTQADLEVIPERDLTAEAVPDVETEDVQPTESEEAVATPAAAAKKKPAAKRKTKKYNQLPTSSDEVVV